MINVDAATLTFLCIYYRRIPAANRSAQLTLVVSLISSLGIWCFFFFFFCFLLLRLFISDYVRVASFTPLSDVLFLFCFVFFVWRATYGSARELFLFTGLSQLASVASSETFRDQYFYSSAYVYIAAQRIWWNLKSIHIFVAVFFFFRDYVLRLCL